MASTPALFVIHGFAACPPSARHIPKGERSANILFHGNQLTSTQQHKLAEPSKPRAVVLVLLYRTNPAVKPLVRRDGRKNLRQRKLPTCRDGQLHAGSAPAASAPSSFLGLKLPFQSRPEGGCAKCACLSPVVSSNTPT